MSTESTRPRTYVSTGSLARSRSSIGHRRLSSQIVVIGAGGHGREVADIVRAAANRNPELSLIGLVDDATPDLDLLDRSGISFLGSTDDVLAGDFDILIGVGDPHIRQRIDQAISSDYDRTARPVMHPSATVGSLCDIGAGVVLAQEATLTTNVKLGRHTHLNVGASVSHDCVLGDFVTVCPGVRVTGNVTVGDRVFIGTGAVLLPGVTVGDDVMIGGGAVVCEDIATAATVKGVPAR